MKLKREPEDKKKNRTKSRACPELRRRAFNYALWLLGRRAYTEKQIREKLQSKEFEEKEIDVAIDRLFELKFLDDFEFAKSFIRQAKQGKPKGKRRLVFELKIKGVARELIDRALEAEDFTESEEDLVKQALKSYLKKIAGLPREKQYNRAMGFLLRRGFDYEKAKKAFQSLTFK